MNRVFVAASAFVSVGISLSTILVVVTACTPQGRVEAPVDLEIPKIGAEASAPIASGAPPQGHTSDPRTMVIAGRWEGTGIQSDGLSWPMTVDIRGFSGVCAVADYPSIPCKGEWTCESGEPPVPGKPPPGSTPSKGATDPKNVIEATEHLTGDSAQRCIDNGSMQMRIVGEDTMMWLWVGQGLTAAAELHRVK